MIPLQNWMCGSGDLGWAQLRASWLKACAAHLRPPPSSSPAASRCCFACLWCHLPQDLQEQTDSPVLHPLASQTRVIPSPQPGARASLYFCVSLCSQTKPEPRRPQPCPSSALRSCFLAAKRNLSLPRPLVVTTSLVLDPPLLAAVWVGGVTGGSEVPQPPRGG